MGYEQGQPSVLPILTCVMPLQPIQDPPPAAKAVPEAQEQPDQAARSVPDEEELYTEDTAESSGKPAGSADGAFGWGWLKGLGGAGKGQQKSAKQIYKVGGILLPCYSHRRTKLIELLTRHWRGVRMQVGVSHATLQALLVSRGA